jgi:hypothetical protein
VVDWEEFTSRVALHDALAAWLDEAVATTNTTTTNSSSSSSSSTTTTTTTTSITNFIETHQIDIGFNSRTQRARSRRKTRLRHFREFARQLIKLRHLGVVHGETHDNRGLGLFLLNSHAQRWRSAAGERKLLAALCEIGGTTDSMWTTNQPQVVAALERLDLRSVVSRSHRGDKLAFLVGPLSWLNHSLRSGVVLGVGTRLLKKSYPENGMLFGAAGYDDRSELLIRYDSPDSASWDASVAQHAWYDDRKEVRKRKR